jgi:methionine-gamma-lyase
MLFEGTRLADPVFGSINPPIYLTSTYIFPNAKEGADRFSGKKKGMIYSRFTNPTVSALEARLAKLEKGEMAVATSSGMSAIVTTLLHFLKTGDSIIAHSACYGGTVEFLSRIAPRFGITTHFVDFSDIKNVEKVLDKTTKMIYFESPTNPLLEVFDIRKIAKFARKNKLLTVFDNTFAPPPAQYPLSLGVDIVIHSLTKYIGGHSDLIGGAVIGSKKLVEQFFLKTYAFMGPTISPFSAYLAMRGLTTLNMRYKYQSESALTIARFLEKHPRVVRVHYPGLSSHPHHGIAKRQMKYHGGVMSFEVKGGRKQGEKMVNAVKVIKLAVSLGAVESLIEHPASMTHSELTPVELKHAGISEGLIRLSVGLENTDDVIYDLKRAL